MYIDVHFVKNFYKRGMLHIAESRLEHERTVITVMPSKVK